jgi:Mg/Co/Ni transporter MgtE
MIVDRTGYDGAFFVAAMVAILDGFWWLVVFPVIRQVKPVGY